jgi:glycosyltransferase involved in cell wall biosynthesis
LTPHSAAASGPPAEAAPARVRIIHNFFHPDVSSVSQVITEIARELAATGYAVSVIASKNRYTGGRDPRLVSRERIENVEVRRVWGPSLGKGSLFGRLLDQASFIVGATLSALSAPKADTVVLLTNPPLFAALGLLLKRLRRERFIYVVMDLYPDIAIESGLLRAESFPVRCLRWLTRRTIRGADCVVVLGSCMEARVLAYGASPDRVAVIRNWADDHGIRPVPPEENSFRVEQGWDGKFVVMYSGNLGVAHRFDDILEVARRRRNDPQFVFAFVGDGMRRKEIEAYREEHGLENICLLPYQSVDRLALSLGAGDVHFVSLREGFEGTVVPSKTYGIMAAARPILYQGGRSGEIARMILDHGLGEVVPEGDADALERVIAALRDEPERTKRLGCRAREVLQRDYSRDAAIAHYRRVLSGGVA